MSLTFSDDYMAEFVTELVTKGMKLTLPAAMAWANLELGQTEDWPGNNNPFNVLFIGSETQYNNVKDKIATFANSSWGPVNKVGSIVSFPTVKDGADAVFAVWSYHNFAPFLASINATDDPSEQLKVIASSPWGPYSPAQESELLTLVGKYVPSQPSDPMFLEPLTLDAAISAIGELSAAWQHNEAHLDTQALVGRVALAMRLYIVSQGWGVLQPSGVGTLNVLLHDGRVI